MSSHIIKEREAHDSRFTASLFCDLPQPCSDPEVPSVEIGGSKEEPEKVSDKEERSEASGNSAELQVRVSRLLKVYFDQPMLGSCL